MEQVLVSILCLIVGVNKHFTSSKTVIQKEIRTQWGQNKT